MSVPLKSRERQVMPTCADEAARVRHVNQWVLLDAQAQVLSIGSALHRGRSPRSALDVTARHILLPRMHNALLDGRELTGLARFDGRGWQTRVVPIVGPVSQTPLAVLGCYGPDADDFPAPPLLGSWEWRLTPPGPGQLMRSYWSPELYDVYGMPRPRAEAPRWWDGPQWLDELVLDSDRVDMRRVLEDCLHADPDTPFLQTYRTRSPATNEIHLLRLTGRSHPVPHGAGRWLRGISTRIDNTAEHTVPRTAGVVDAVFALSADPLCALDVAYEHIFMTSRTFPELRLDLPPHRYVPDMVHPEDLQLLRNFFKETVARPTEPVGPVRARFAGIDGGWQTLTLTGAGMPLSIGTTAHHILCRITPARPCPSNSPDIPHDRALEERECGR